MQKRCKGCATCLLKSKRRQVASDVVERDARVLLQGSICERRNKRDNTIRIRAHI